MTYRTLHSIELDRVPYGISDMNNQMPSLWEDENALKHEVKGLLLIYKTDVNFLPFVFEDMQNSSEEKMVVLQL